MSENYGCFLTTAGLAAITNARLTGNILSLTHIAIGDSEKPITQDMKKLNNEVYRVALNRLALSPTDSTILEADGYIAADAGGWTIREAGIFDSAGILIAVAKYPPTYKPALETGAAVDLQIRILFRTENAASVALLIDPAVIMASRAYVDNVVLSLSLATANSLVNLQHEQLKQADKIKLLTGAY